MNKGVGNKQPWLRNRWFEQDGFALHSLCFFKKATVPWYKKEYSKFLRKEICGRKKS